MICSFSKSCYPKLFLLSSFIRSYHGKVPPFNQVAKIFSSPSGIMAQGTRIYGEQKIRLNIIISLHNIYLRNLKDPKNANSDFLTFIEKTFFIEPKLMQHVLAIYYPTFKFPLEDIRSRYSQISITDPNSSYDVSFDLLFPVIVAQKLMIQNPLFKEGRLYVLGCPDAFKREHVKKAYDDCLQPNPDFYYVYNKNKNIMEKHYDLKTGNFKVNTGHIVCAQEGKAYEELSQKMLLGQQTSYASKVEIKEKLEELIKNKTLTWGERNEAFQLFLKENLCNYPDINPSFVFKTKLSYEIINTRPHKLLSTIVEDSACLENIQESQKTLSKGLINGGQKCYNNYKELFGTCPAIKKTISDFVAEKLKEYNLE